MNKKTAPQKIAITMGDFNGIGPEVITKALNRLDLPCEKVVLVGARELFVNLKKDYKIIDIPFEKQWLKIGSETKEAGEFSFNCLQKACQMAENGEICAIVTAPVSKNAMHLAGHFFSGQTEVIEKNLAAPVAGKKLGQKAEMLFVCRDFRVLLLTRHIALNEVKITKELLIEKINRINSVLKNNFGIKKPKIALCSLNPHAGENGILGDEEIVEFAPALKILRDSDIEVSDPLPADTLFAKAAKSYKTRTKLPYDCYCACYHDQGLIPIKTLAMDKTVNMTVGLNIIRTSPAHGTAYDIAGKNLADETSMVCAIKESLTSSLIS